MLFGLDAWLFWMLLAIVLFIAELFTPSFFLACLGIGAAIAVIPSLLDLGLAWQLAFFSIGSLLSILFIRPLINKRKGQVYSSGIDGLVGKRLRLSTDIPTDGYTELPIDGDVWRVEMRDKSFCPKGTSILITGYNGIILQASVVSES